MVGTNQTIISLLGIFVLCVASFYAALYIIKRWTGCSSEEAKQKIHKIFKSGHEYQLETDTALIMDIQDNIWHIIGEERYKRLCEYNKTAIEYPLIWFGAEGKLRYIAISVDILTDKNERDRIENLIIHRVFKTYLARAGYSILTYHMWRKRDDLCIPVLLVFYAKGKEEEDMLRIRMKNRRHLHKK